MCSYCYRVSREQTRFWRSLETRPYFHIIPIIYWLIRWFTHSTIWCRRDYDWIDFKNGWRFWVDVQETKTWLKERVEFFFSFLTLDTVFLLSRFVTWSLARCRVFNCKLFLTQVWLFHMILFPLSRFVTWSLTRRMEFAYKPSPSTRLTERSPKSPSFNLVRVLVLEYIRWKMCEVNFFCDRHIPKGNLFTVYSSICYCRSLFWRSSVAARFEGRFCDCRFSETVMARAGGRPEAKNVQVELAKKNARGWYVALWESALIQGYSYWAKCWE